jgi:tetratricopeptide (TPR) repeat protein
VTATAVDQAMRRLAQRDPMGALDILASDPEGTGSADWLFAACTAHVQLKHWDEVERLAQRTLALDPQHARAAYYLGVACERQGHTERAADAFQRAAAIDPRFREARAKLESYGIAVPRPTPDALQASSVASPPTRPAPRDTELTLPANEDEWRAYETAIQRKKRIDAKADYSAQMRGLPWWAKILVVLVVAWIVVTFIQMRQSNAQFNDEFNNYKRDIQQQTCDIAKQANQNPPPGC